MAVIVLALDFFPVKGETPEAHQIMFKCLNVGMFPHNR